MARCPVAQARDRSHLAESLVFQVLEAPLGEQATRVAELSVVYPELAPALRRRLAALQTLRSLGGGEGEPPLEFGPFERLRRIGAGGMGVVWLARNRVARRLVALKLIRQDLLAQPAARERFRQEMRLAVALRHPNLCPVYGTGEIQGTPYIEMRFLRGSTLAESIQTARREHALPEGAKLSKLLWILEKIARALHAAHQEGLIHQDVKPANIMVTQAGEPMLLDFGLARGKECEEQGRAPGRSGTPAYMAPEKGAPGWRADRRTDIYGLGATLYECLTLRPLSAPRARELRPLGLSDYAWTDPCQLNPAIPRALQALLEKAMAREPSRRHPTALAFAEDLRRLRMGATRGVPRAGPGTPCGAPPRPELP